MNLIVQTLCWGSLQIEDSCRTTRVVYAMGVDYVVIGFDMEVQPLITHNAAWPLCVSAFCIDHLHMPHRCHEHTGS